MAPSAALALDIDTALPGPERPDGKTAAALALAPAAPPTFSPTYTSEIRRVTLLITAFGTAAAMTLTVIRWLRRPRVEQRRGGAIVRRPGQRRARR